MIERPIITIVIPVEASSEQLDRTIDLVNQYTSNYVLHIEKDSTINVAEARAKAMEKFKDQRFICFLDYDSEMFDPKWLDKMFETLFREKASVVFPIELWGTSKMDMRLYTEAPPNLCKNDHEIGFGPAACMLIDMNRIPREVKWDNYIGLRNGWLGGDFEEVDYCYKITRFGGKIFRCVSTAFHHTGGKTTFDCYGNTDRGRTSRLMGLLLEYKYHLAPEDEDFFKGLHYVKADPNNDLMLASGESLRDCYKDIIIRNGLEKIPSIRKKGLG